MAQKWQIGDVKVTKVVEIEALGGMRRILPDATYDEVKTIDWLHPHFCDEEGRLFGSIHAFLIETPDRRIVVDTCIGNDKPRGVRAWNMLQTSFLNDLNELGFDRARVDTVLCTHLHIDHVGWNTMLVDGKWVPTFSNARYLVAEKEWRYWDANEDEQEYGSVLADSVRPVVDAGLVDFVSVEEKLCDEVWLEPTPGHTPGHVSVRIASCGEDAVITGDLIHHPVQCGEVEWASRFDVDPAMALRTRRSFLTQCAEAGTRVLGTHFATPTVGRVVVDGEVFRFEAESND